jgi:hypothetical protein
MPDLTRFHKPGRLFAVWSGLQYKDSSNLFVSKRARDLLKKSRNWVLKTLARARLILQLIDLLFVCSCMNLDKRPPQYRKKKNNPMPRRQKRISPKKP